MKITTRFANYGNFINLKVDENETDIFPNGNESNEVISNLLQTCADICKIRNETLFDFLEAKYNIKIIEYPVSSPSTVNHQPSTKE